MTLDFYRLYCSRDDFFLGMSLHSKPYVGRGHSEVSILKVFFMGGLPKSCISRDDVTRPAHSVRASVMALHVGCVKLLVKANVGKVLEARSQASSRGHRFHSHRGETQLN